MLTALAFMQLATVTLPYPWLEYCHRTRDPGCIVETISAQDLALINMEVTEAITTLENPDYYDPWQAFPENRTGDCDDDAATKRAALLALGFDPKALWFETGTANGERHIVLVARLGGREYVLDRKTPDRVYTTAKRPYEWKPIARESSTAATWEQAE